MCRLLNCSLLRASLYGSKGGLKARFASGARCPKSPDSGNLGSGRNCHLTLEQTGSALVCSLLPPLPASFLRCPRLTGLQVARQLCFPVKRSDPPLEYCLGSGLALRVSLPRLGPLVLDLQRTTFWIGLIMATHHLVEDLDSRLESAP